MNYKSFNDYELIYMIRENDDFSQNVLFDKYKPVVMSIANEYYEKYKNNGYEYDDFLQEALIGFQNALFSFDEEKNSLFYTFVVVCIHRKLLSFCRMFMSKKNVLGNLNNISLENIDVQDSRGNIDSIFNEKEFEFLLKKIIFDLSWEQGMVFELKMNGFQYIEISQLLDIPLKQVGAIIRVVKKTVKHKINQYYCK